MSVLVELFRHHRWANDTLYAACEGLDDDQLEATVAGTMGSIRDTLHHLANAERYYVSALKHEPIERRMTEFPGVTALRAQVGRQGDDLIALAGAADPEGVWRGQWGGREAEIPSAIFFIQAINHATEHRSQVMTILSQLGIEPPVVDAWNFLRRQG
jgi:uncharacterized damage-inducible protein DinB